MYRLFKFEIEILDDETFSKEEMETHVKEALEVHLEATHVNIKCKSAEDVICDIYKMAEA